jgi:tetratricopeptide (TPR) repeat protein
MLSNLFKSIIVVSILSSIVVAQHTGHQMKRDEKAKPATLITGMGILHHPVSTKNQQAQKFFDQGLSFVFAFNHEQAVRSFKRAAQLDPKLAMAHWGIALALGPNINLDIDPEREKAAYDAVQKALALSKNAPANERAYIEVLSRRYSNDPKADLKKLAVDYKNGMGELVKRYPDDLDAATLYAESAMNLRPWQLWSLDGTAAEGTEEIVAVLESVLRRNPNHHGAIHYYIHAVEASRTPERALAHSQRLGKLVPAAGHLVHMPAHIFQRVGDYDNAARSNEDAARADRAHILSQGAQGFYPAMYYSHNLHFLAIAYNMQGRYGDAAKAANALEQNVAPHLKEMPMLEGFMIVLPLLHARFSRWEDIDRIPQPDKSQVGTTAVVHFARGFAMASRGRTAEAEQQLSALMETEKRLPADAMFGLNPARRVLEVARKVLQARVAAGRNDRAAAIAMLTETVPLEDAFAYDEPQAWFWPVREMLGGLLLRDGKFAEAESVFRADLERNKRNGRSLFGLLEALKGQQKTEAAADVEREFKESWKKADTILTVADL